MFFVGKRPKSCLRLFAGAAGIFLACLFPAPPFQARAQEPLEEPTFRGNSWLWKWADPYRPEMLLMSGGRASFLRGQGKLRPPENAVRQLTVDPKSGSVQEVLLYRGNAAAQPIPMTLNDYRPYLTRHSWRDSWRAYSKRGLARQAGSGPAAGTLKLELPVAVPRTIQKVIGRGKPNLRVSGSETITISGRSSWEVGRKANEAGNQSIFPQLNLKQELAVNVSGEIGDKINVDIDQNSKESLANRIRINYRGYEDEIIQTLDLGNTNLSLPGAQFVSYNGRHQGLFGVKTSGRLGDVDLTLIASKQEGQSESNRFVGSSTVRTSRISDVNYTARTFYFLGDPREWPFKVDLASLEVFKDDRNAQNNQGEFRTVPAEAYVYEAEYETLPDKIVRTGPLQKTDDYLVGDFDRLQPYDDYKIIFLYENCPTIWLTRSLGEGEVLAVAYYDSTLGVNIGNTEVPEGTPGQLRLLKAPAVNLVTTEDGLYDPDGVFYPTLRYEMKNIYNLGAQDILEEGFDLTIQPKSGTVYDDDLNGIPYVRLLGLDRLDQNGLSAFDEGGLGADGQIDVNQGSVFLGLGLLVFPDLRPFAPDEVDTLFWRPLFFPEGVYRGAGSEFPYYPPLTGEEDAIPDIYDKKNIIHNQDTKYQMSVEFRSNLYGETIFLKGNILEGSETVIANGQRLEKDRDYTIDYDVGAVTLISDIARESAADITIDYSFKPLFAMGQRTLLGFSTSYQPVDDHGFATTWIYESKGATERRPKLGEEPSLTVIGDVSGSLRKKPQILTRLIDRLPLISTDSPSSINMSGELGMSFPNPNTENNAYVEDFEGSRDDFMVDLSRLRWFHSSLPEGIPSDPTYKAAMRWYNPRKERRVRADALQPELTSLEGDDSVEAFELDIAPRAGRSDSWAGITQAISKDGVDFSRKQYLEIWVNDAFTDENGITTFFGDTFHNPDSARIYIDIGAVSEDAWWNINEEPNGRGDTEDENGDLQLDDSDILQEDTGLDKEFTSEEGAYSPDRDQTGAGSPEDPHGDEYDLDPDLSDLNWNKFLKINGTEDNDRLDTEDLNRDGFVDAFRNSYFEYCVNLADSKYLDTVVEDAGVRTGWRRYRIPVKAGVDTTYGSPSLDSIEHVRIWFTGFSVRSRIQIAKMGFTGNRWATEGVFDSTETAVPREESEAVGEEFLVGVINNKDDKSFYAPPFDPGEDGNIPRREQSLLVTYRNIRPGNQARAFRAFDPPQDYTLYRTLKFYLWGERDDPDVHFFTRIGDNRSYYQIELPMKAGWQQVVVDLQDLTHLKNTDVADSIAVGERIYKVVGMPRFTQVRRVTMGIVNNGEFDADGRLYFNDIRLGAVRRDIGVASRFNVQASLADLMNLSGSYEGQDEDFLGIGTNKGSGIDRKRVSLGGKFNAHTLMAPLRLTLPISFNFSQNTSVPKFKTGDDRELLESEIGNERSISKSTALSADLARSPSRNPFLRYSIDAMRANVQWRKNRNVSPVRADTTETVSTRLRYDISPPPKPVPVMPGLRLNFLPSNLSLSFGTTSETRTSFDKDAGYRTKNVTTKPATMQLDVGYRPVSSIATNFGLTSQRDLMRKRPLDFLGGVNIGTEISRKENIRANFSPRLFWWMGSPSFNYSGSYSENHNPGLTTEQDRAAGESRRNAGNSRSLRGSVNLPLGRYMGLLGGAGGDSASAASPLFWTRSLLNAIGQFGQVTLTRTITDNSTYNGIYGVPDLKYKLGLSRDLGRESRTAPSGSERRSNAVKTEARSDGTLFKDYRVSVAYLLEEREDQNTAGNTSDEAVSWPDVKLDISSLEKRLGLQNRLTRLSAQVSYVGRKTENSMQGGKQTSISESKNWRPLLSLNAVWAGGLTTTFTSNRKTEERTTKNAGIGQTRTITSSTYSLNLQKTVRGGEGVKLPFGGRSGSFQKTINFNLNLLYSKNASSRLIGAGKTIVDSDNDKLRATSRATYNFSSNMTGTLELGFDQTRNMKVGRTVRGVQVSASARLRF